VLYHLAQLADEGVLDPDDVFLDSPMSIKATDIYKRARSEHDEEFLELVQNELDPLGPDRFHRCRTVDESKTLNDRRRPAVIVASSGMATGGRVVHHLLHRLGDKKNTVVFVGYQAAGTRGRALVEGADKVAIHGLDVPVRATIRYFHMLSAHADSHELLRWCQELPDTPRRIFINHGEDPSRKALAASLAENGFPRPHLPLSRQSVPW
jgi:metallo-beta-lactamase family protein